MGVLLKDEQLIDDALNQYYWHIKYLQDPESGLYYHGYNNITGDHMSGIKWGRANAWPRIPCLRWAFACRSATCTPSFWMLSAA